MKKYPLILVALIVAALSWNASSLVASESNYQFKVKNTTKNTITKLLASEDGKTYGNFDIGKGIKPGQTVTLVWDKSTDGEECEQWFKAVFDDGEESEAKKFDFCEDDLELEF
jgi:P pilus assembly chaperone PapD